MTEGGWCVAGGQLLPFVLLKARQEARTDPNRPPASAMTLRELCALAADELTALFGFNPLWRRKT